MPSASDGKTKRSNARRTLGISSIAPGSHAHVDPNVFDKLSQFVQQRAVTYDHEPEAARQIRASAPGLCKSAHERGLILDCRNSADGADHDRIAVEKSLQKRIGFFRLTRCEALDVDSIADLTDSRR